MVDGLNHSIEMIEDRIGEVEDKSIEFTQTQQERENALENSERPQRLMGQQQES